jgi:signal transduction histidine kinase
MLASSRARRVGIDTIAEETQELVRLEKEHTIDPGEESQTRGQMQKLLWIGLILNISVAIGLAAYFNRGTVQRLQVLMENSQRLTRKEPLNPPLAGGDEIADLDRVFHEMAASLAEADRMKQEFVAMVSHDLRAPLSSVRGALDLVARGTYGALSEKGKQILATADGSVRRLIKLVNDILDVEKLETGKLDFLPEAVSVARIIQRSLDSVRTLAEQSQCPLSADDPEFNIYADEDRLVQVLVNLLSNAIKFSPKGESVQITTCSDDGWIEVRVADRGCGIPLEHQQAIFERFRQIKVSDSKEKGGTGLGLAICKAIIEQHGGSIGVDSEVGKGSTFWFRLPAGVPPAIASLGASGSPE